MPPIAKSKGGAAAARSRHTTPLSAASAEPGSATRRTPSAAAISPPMSYSEIIEMCPPAKPPPSASLQKVLDGLKQRSEVARSRSTHHDTSFRDFARRVEEQRERQLELEARRRREEEEMKAKILPKSPKREEPEEAQRPPAVGARGLARQDGGDSEGQPIPDEDTKASMEVPPREVERKPSREEQAASEDEGAAPHQPRPAPARPQYQTFGPDPSTFDDPTIYHIQEVNSTTSEEEKKAILGVKHYPPNSLYELTCGKPPDRNLENSKPAQQTSAATFAQFLEPFFREYKEEDLSFLNNRGDRVGPMVLPPRGTRSYREVWAEEDQAMYGDTTSSAPNHTVANEDNQAHGSIEQMNEDEAENSNVSIGPMLARLLQCLRPERRGDHSANVNQVPTTNGDTTMTNGMFDGDVSMTDGPLINPFEEQAPAPPPPPAPTRRETLPAASALPEGSAPTTARNANLKPNWVELDERVKAELRHIGFLSEDAEPDYDGHHDDDIAARLRFLQEELHKVSVMNGARKAKVLEVVENDMARQEYEGIMLDLDHQLNQAYLKRHRNTGKGKGKLKRTGAAAALGGAGTAGVPNGVAVPAGAGYARSGLGAPINSLMERRQEWLDKIGPVVNWGHADVARETLFPEKEMEEYLIRERENWTESQE